MGRFGNAIKELFKNQSETTITTMNFHEFFKTGESGSDLSEVVYYICMKVLSESLGKLPIHLKGKDNKKITNHIALQVLKYKPNGMMTSSTFKTLMEFNRNHYGNAYAYLKYKGGKLESIYPLDPKCVKILVDNKNILKGKDLIYYEYTNNGRTEVFRSEDILHLKGGLSQNGIVGVSVRETLATTIGGIKASQKYLNELYKNGLTAKAILKYTGDLSTEKEKTFIEKLAKFGRSKASIIPLPMGTELIPLNLKLTDSQFYELKKYTALQIAGAFGVKPNHLNDYEKSSYANSEMQNLTFYIDTLLYILTLYEEEFNQKLLSDKDREEGLHFKFNIASILRGDMKAQAECIRIYVSSGIYTPNEARELVGLPPIEGGDVIMVNGSNIKLEDLGIAYKNKQGGGE